LRVVTLSLESAGEVGPHSMAMRSTMAAAPRAPILSFSTSTELTALRSPAVLSAVIDLVGKAELSSIAGASTAITSLQISLDAVFSFSSV